MCAYENSVGGPIAGRGIFNPTTDGAGSTTRFGAGVYIIGSAGNKWIGGTWAATAPLGPAPRVVPWARRLNR